MDDQDPRAAEAYEVELVARERGRVRRALSAAGHLTLASLGGLLDLPLPGDVVVRLRAGGTEVLRVPVGSQDEAARMLTDVQEQLATLTVDDFRTRWSLG